MRKLNLGLLAVAAVAIVFLPPTLFSQLPESYSQTAAAAVSAAAIIIYTGLVARSVSQSEEHYERDRAQDLRSLKLLCDHLAAQVRDLPETPGSFREVQKLGVWTPGDVTRLSQTAPLAGKSASDRAIEVIKALRWLGSRIRKVQVGDQEHAGAAFRTQIVESDWKDTRGDCLDGLSEIGTKAERTARRIEEEVSV